MEIIHICQGLMLAKNDVAAVIDIALLPADYLTVAKRDGVVIDTTQGKAVRSIVYTKSGRAFLTSVHQTTLVKRLQEADTTA